MSPERILIVATASLTDAAVRRAVADEDLAGAEVRVLAPAVNRSALAYWVSDPDEAIADAKGTAGVAADAAQEEDRVGTVSTEAGESDPAEAVENALRTFPADRILVVRRTGDDAAYREDELDAGELEARLGPPVAERALASPD